MQFSRAKRKFLWAVNCHSNIYYLPHDICVFQVVEQLQFHQVILYESCREKWPSTDIKVAYNIAVVLIQAVLPATVLLVVHIRIAAYLHAHTASQKDSRRAQRELQRNKRTTLLLIGNLRHMWVCVHYLILLT